MAFIVREHMDSANAACKSVLKLIEKHKDADGNVIDREGFDKDFEQLKEIINSEYDILIGFWRRHLIVAQDSLYGTILLQMGMKTDFTLDGAIETDVYSDTMCIYLNPLYMSDYSAENIEALICAEIIKIAMGYPTRFSTLNPQRDENKHISLMHAASVSSLELVKNEVAIKVGQTKGPDKTACLKLPNDVYLLEDLRNDYMLKTRKNAQEKKALEYYYYIYDSNLDPDKQPNNGNQGLSSRNQNSTSQMPSTPNSRTGRKPNQWENEAKREEIRSKLKNMVSAAMNSIPSDKRGLIPGEIMSSINALLAPPQIPWHKKIPKYIGTLPYKHRKTSMRQNRKQPYRMDLLGELPDRLVRIIVILDTSGSMDELTTKYCLNEIFALLKQIPSEVLLIQCDAEVQGEPIKMKSIKDWPGGTFGHGGTAFTPAINYINKHNFKDALAIYLTDGYGEDEIPKPNVAKFMWVVKNDREYLSVKKPYGSVDFLKDDPKFEAMINKRDI